MPVRYSRSSQGRKHRGPWIPRTQGPFTWDPDAGLLRYDGSGDTDPRWKWDPQKQGYVPVDAEDEIFNRQLGFWVSDEGIVH